MEIARLTERLAAARKAQSGLQGEIDAVAVELRLQEARLTEATTARDLAARRVAAGEREVARLQGALDTARDDLKRHLTGLYRLGRQGYLRLFLSLKPDRRLLPSIRLMRYLARRDRSAIDRYQEARVNLRRERDQLVARRQETRALDRQRADAPPAARGRRGIARRPCSPSSRRRARPSPPAPASSATARRSSPASSTSSTAARRGIPPARRCSSSAACSTGRSRGR